LREAQSMIAIVLRSKTTVAQYPERKALICLLLFEKVCLNAFV